MTDRRRASGQQDRPEAKDNPFAPPPEGQPDRPWQPRHPSGPEGEGDKPDEQRQRWGGQWSRRQPGRGPGGFGEPKGEGGKPGGPAGWNPADPVQRHARYAMMAGWMGAISGFLGWEWLALLLGSLALYWGINALRGTPEETGDAKERRVAALEGRSAAQPPPAPVAGPPGRRSHVAPAVAGIVMASLALALVAASYTMQLVYKDYFDCVDEALTTPSRAACEELLPERLRPFLGEDR